MSDGFPTPNGWSVDDSEERPGEPLHPGTNTIVNRGNNPLQVGETVAVWAEWYADGHGTTVCRADLQIIGDNGDGDLFAIHDEHDPLEASCVYRIRADMSTISTGKVVSVPEYDGDEGVLTIGRQVQIRGRQNQTILELRSLGGRADWSLTGSGTV